MIAVKESNPEQVENHIHSVAEGNSFVVGLTEGGDSLFL